MKRWWLKVDVFVVAVCWIALLPFRDEIALAFGYPLRLAATELAVGFLRLCGSPVVNDGTTISLGETAIAITDACSGIEELLALVLAGYLIQRYLQKNLGWTLFAWAFTLPAVILANAIRLGALVLGVGVLGETVLTGAWHSGLGYAQAALAIAFVWGAGKIVRRCS